MFKFLKNLFGKNPFKNGRRLTLAYVLSQSDERKMRLRDDLPKLVALNSFISSPLATDEKAYDKLAQMFGDDVFFYQLLVTELHSTDSLYNFRKFLGGVISVVQML